MTISKLGQDVTLSELQIHDLQQGLQYSLFVHQASEDQLESRLAALQVTIEGPLRQTMPNEAQLRPLLVHLGIASAGQAPLPTSPHAQHNSFTVTGILAQRIDFHNLLPAFLSFQQPADIGLALLLDISNVMHQLCRLDGPLFEVFVWFLVRMVTSPSTSGVTFGFSCALLVETIRNRRGSSQYLGAVRKLMSKTSFRHHSIEHAATIELFRSMRSLYSVQHIASIRRSNEDHLLAGDLISCPTLPKIMFYGADAIHGPDDWLVYRKTEKLYVVITRVDGEINVFWKKAGPTRVHWMGTAGGECRFKFKSSPSELTAFWDEGNDSDPDSIIEIVCEAGVADPLRKFFDAAYAAEIKAAALAFMNLD